MKIMHLLASGGTGGIETLCRDYAQYSHHENTFVFLWGKDDARYLEMKENGADVIQLNASKKHLFRMLKQIDDIRKSKQIQIVVAHHAAPMEYVYLIWAKKRLDSDIKTIIYAHGNAVVMWRANRKGAAIRKKILMAAIKHADQIIAVSKSVKRSLEQYFDVSKGKIDVVYNGVDLRRFRPEEISKRRTNCVQFIYVGRLIEEKGVQFTLKALSELPSELKWSFQIVGDGPYRETLKAYCNQLGLKDKVCFLGTRQDVPDLLSRADVFIHMPVCEEGFGITIIEAMAMGLLCICSDNGAIPEIIHNQNNGLLVESGNIRQLTLCLEYVLIHWDEGKFDILRENGIHDSRRYSSDYFSNQLDQNFERIIL